MLITLANANSRQKITGICQEIVWISIQVRNQKSINELKELNSLRQLIHLARKKKILEKQKLEDFKTWCKQNGIQIDSSIEIIQTSTFSIKATQNLSETSEAVSIIPKTAILSTQNCSLKALFQSPKCDIDGPIALTLAVMRELQLESESRWFAYLSTLPELESGLPLIWLLSESTETHCKQRWEMLQGTELDISVVQADFELMKSDYEDVILKFIKRNKKYFQPILGIHLIDLSK